MEQLIKELYHVIKDKPIPEGAQVASYIPELAKMSPDAFGIAVYSVKDQQLWEIGDTKQSFTMQSMSKPFTYALALKTCGHNKVHKHVGYEPSGRSFNELSLDRKGRPCNPLINAGAIMTASLIDQGQEDPSQRYVCLKNFYQACSGNGEMLGFSNEVFLSEKHHGDGNYGLYYLMSNKKLFPEGTKVGPTLDLYFQACSIEINARIGARMAATLANQGVSPESTETILTPALTKDCLSLMLSCGMYDYSGQFQFDVGIPAKSGVSGGVIAVIPGRYGICIWSPPLDANGNSARAVEFFRLLVKKMPELHVFGGTVSDIHTSTEPSFANIMQACADNNMDLLQRYRSEYPDLDFNGQDYDGRTPLHIALDNQHLYDYLVKECGVVPGKVDRWGHSDEQEK